MGWNGSQKGNGILGNTFDQNFSHKVHCIRLIGAFFSVSGSGTFKVYNNNVLPSKTKEGNYFLFFISTDLIFL